LTGINPGAEPGSPTGAPPGHDIGERVAYLEVAMMRREPLVFRSCIHGVLALGLAGLAGCGGEYSPNTYSATAVQQANKVAQGVVVGVREIKVSASETIGAVAGGAVGGIAGSQVPGSTLGEAFGTVGGTMIGGMVGAGAEHTIKDTKAFEYIVRKSNGDLVSVTQKDEVPLALGQHVLVIAGNQARIVPDYIVPLNPQNAAAQKGEKETATAPDAPSSGATPSVTSGNVKPSENVTAAPRQTADAPSPAALSPVSPSVTPLPADATSVPPPPPTPPTAAPSP